MHWTSNACDVAACQYMIVYLNELTWSAATASSFAEDVRCAMSAGVRLTLVHEMPGLQDSAARRAVEFAFLLYMYCLLWSYTVCSRRARIDVVS